MSDNKKYYYIKLKDNFFDSSQIIALESMPDGYLYSNILLKLYLRSLQSEGKLMLTDRIPFNPTMLAQVTRHSVGVIEKALHIFQDLDIIEVLDNGAIYMLDIQNFIGISSTEADRKRKYRLKISQPLTEWDKYPPEIEIEIKKDIPIEKKHRYGMYDNVLLSDIELDKLKNEFPDYLDRIEKLSEGIASKGYKYKNHLAAIRSWHRNETNSVKPNDTPRKLKQL
jgi:predicted phage replisome organizer